MCYNSPFQTYCQRRVKWHMGWPMQAQIMSGPRLSIHFGLCCCPLWSLVFGGSNISDLGADSNHGMPSLHSTTWSCPKVLIPEFPLSFSSIHWRFSTVYTQRSTALHCFGMQNEVWNKHPGRASTRSAATLLGTRPPSRLGSPGQRRRAGAVQ